MYLTRLELTNFRNFTRLTVDVPAGALLLVGENAQGKTSLLEAVYFLSAFTSFHASSDRQLINFLIVRQTLAVSRIVAEYTRGSQSHHIEVRIIQERNGFNGTTRVRKEILLDGVKRKANETFGHLNTVLFLPQMLAVIEGGPAERRRYLNLTLAQVIPHYAASLSAYNRAVTQRNALLKRLNERGGDPQLLDYWDEQVAKNGAFLIKARIQAVQELEEITALIHQDVTRKKEILRLAYQPAYDPLPKPANQFELPFEAPVDRSGFSPEDIQEGFQKALLSRRAQEIARGQTTIGPHRDELRFLANGEDLGTYGSRGQVRTTMLSLKLAEVIWMKNKTNEWPILLLDEVLAELDLNRREDLLARLGECEQMLLTTTDLGLFSESFQQNTAIWRVHQGQVQTSTTR